MTKKRGRRPTASKLAERRANKPTNQVKMPTDVEKEWLDTFYGKIFFWSFTFGRVRPSDHSSIFRVCTHRYIPKHKLLPLIDAAFPDGCKTTLVRGYSFTHSFDVRTSAPLMWSTFITRIAKALEDVL